MSAIKSACPDLNRPYVSPARGLISCVLALAALGIIMLLSTSYFWSIRREGIRNAFHLFQKQMIYVLSSFIILILTSQVPLRWIKRATWPAYVGSVLLLLLVFVPGIGVDHHGSHRWVNIAGFGMQPSELAKLAVIMAVAYYAAQDSERMKTLKGGFLMSMLIIGIPSALVVLEPDLGTGTFIAGVGVMVALAAGMRFVHLIPSVCAAVPLLLGVFWYRFAHFRERIEVFLNPGSDPLGTGHQIRQSLIAIGSGGKYGAGLGMSTQKLFYLPQPNSDFIYSIIGEEIGFVGCLLVILLYMGIVWFGCQIARKAEDRFGKLVAIGITVCISLQALLNIAIATAVFPTTGLPLPLLSHGGSSLFVTLFMVGVLLAVHNHSPNEVNADDEQMNELQVSG